MPRLHHHHQHHHHLLLLLGLAALVTLSAGQECIHPFSPIGGTCIYIDPWQSGTMEEVRAICKSHHGDLLWFNDDEECDIYLELLAHIHETSLNEKNYWMGITDEEESGDWRYLKTNTPVRLGPPYWDVNFPSTTQDKNCAYFSESRDYYWWDVSCTSIFYTICRYT